MNVEIQHFTKFEVITILALSEKVKKKSFSFIIRFLGQATKPGSDAL